MKRNRIKIVESLTFKGMESLKSLKMQRNGVAKLMDGAFFGLNNIEELWGSTHLIHNILTENCFTHIFPYIYVMSLHLKTIQIRHYVYYSSIKSDSHSRINIIVTNYCTVWPPISDVFFFCLLFFYFFLYVIFVSVSWSTIILLRLTKAGCMAYACYALSGSARMLWASSAQMPGNFVKSWRNCE